MREVCARPMLSVRALRNNEGLPHAEHSATTLGATGQTSSTSWDRSPRRARLTNVRHGVGRGEGVGGGTPRRPVLVVMGVSGSGKTTVGRSLAARTGWGFLDADDLHSPDAVARMAAGTPLTDADRWPWLARVADWIAARYRLGEPGVVACSALKRAYRDLLRQADPDLRFVYLRATPDQIAERLSRRDHHFFPPVLAAAQFTDLEEPGVDESTIIVPLGQTPDASVDAILTQVFAQ